MKTIYLTVVILSLTSVVISAQNPQEDNSDDYLKMRWRNVATEMSSEWYGSDEAKSVAENVLIAQKDIGGWAKNKPYHRELSESDKQRYIKGKTKDGASFDNGATIQELRFLAKVYAHFEDERYKQAFEKGLDYIFDAQYENGGWPQFYPVRAGQSVSYSSHITYNDNAMVNTMTILKEISAGNEEFASLQLSSETKVKAQKAFDKGLQCILNTQIFVDDRPTVWCAQHNEITLAPANARTYELASFSGAESVGIVLLLMNIDIPSEDIIASVNGAVEWFEDHKIEGIKVVRETREDGKRNKIVVEDKDAPALWARFYDLESSMPFFCDRDGIKKYSLAEIGHNRRNGYRWYTGAPAEVLERYPEWLKKL